MVARHRALCQCPRSKASRRQRRQESAERPANLQLLRICAAGEARRGPLGAAQPAEAVQAGVGVSSVARSLTDTVGCRKVCLFQGGGAWPSRRARRVGRPRSLSHAARRRAGSNQDHTPERNRRVRSADPRLQGDSCPPKNRRFAAGNRRDDASPALRVGSLLRAFS